MTPEQAQAIAEELLPCLEGVCRPELHDALCGRQWRTGIAAALLAATQAERKRCVEKVNKVIESRVVDDYLFELGESLVKAIEADDD